MMSILADASIVVTPVQMGVFVACLFLFLSLQSKLAGLQDRIVAQVLTAVEARLGQQAASRIPSPIITETTKIYAERDSFHKHAELNRDEHSRIENKFDDAVKGIKEDVSEIAVQVAEIKVLREQNGEAVHVLSGKVDEIGENLSEMSGALHQALRPVVQPAPRRRNRRKTKATA